MMEKLNKKEELISVLLFSRKTEFKITIEEYCSIDKRSDFKEEIRTVLKRGNITILEDTIIHTDEKIIWKIIIKRENAVVKKHK